MNDIVVTLSNTRYSGLHPCSNHTIFLDGTTWRTIIHYYYGKQLRDGGLIYQVLLAATPDDARNIATAAADSARIEWTQQTPFATIRKAYHGKIMEHATVRNALLRTSAASISIGLTDCGSWTLDPAFASGQLFVDAIADIRRELTKHGPFDELKDPMLPPWLRFPNIAPHSIGWRMGAGEGYLCKFNPWYHGLTPEGRKKYREIYPPPKGWR